MRSISYKNSVNEVKKTVLGNAENTLYTVVYGNGSHVAEGKKLNLWCITPLQSNNYKSKTT